MNYAALARGFNGGAAVGNWTFFILWGSWFNAGAGAASTLVFLAFLAPLASRWWHRLFHMAEPCGACGHTRKHNHWESDWCNEPCDPKTYNGITNHCLCNKEKMNEHRIAEASRQGSAGAAAFAPGGSINPYGPSSPYANPYANPYATGTNPSLTQGMRQALQQAAIGMQLGPLHQEADWTDETYTGYRAFVLFADRERGVFRLKSITNGTVWESATLDAECKRKAYLGTVTPVSDMTAHMPACNCGIYLCLDKETVVRQTFIENLEEQQSLVLGECVGWGTVVEHTEGMRVEHARIERLWTLSGKPELCDRLAGIYGVPATNLWASIK